MAKTHRLGAVQEHCRHHGLSWRGSVIGVYDSGIGGLSVLRALQALMPQQDYVYLADSGHGPYGERDSDHVLARAQRVTHWLVERGIDALVVACNTATAVAIEALRGQHPELPIIGVEPALKPAVSLSRTGRIGVMATRATLTSPKFARLLQSLQGQAHFECRACDGLALAIERSADLGPTASSAAQALAELRSCAQAHVQALGPLGRTAIDTVVLGCTHYPLISPLLQEWIGPDIQLLDTGSAVARQTLKRLQEAGLTEPLATQGVIELLSTGSVEALQAAAQRWVEGPKTVRALHLP